MSTKTQTTVADMAKTIAMRKSEKLAEIHRKNHVSFLDSGDSDRLASTVSKFLAARDSRDTAREAVAKIPLSRRDNAARLVHEAENIALGYAKSWGGLYSGETTHSIKWGDNPIAETWTGHGAQYSRSCTYNRTDADHVITLSPLGAIGLVNEPEIRQTSANEGLPLIALFPSGKKDPANTYPCAWLKSGKGGKSLDYQTGWIACENGIAYHSTASAGHARNGLDKKLDAARKAAFAAIASKKERRRLALVLRLCNGIQATLEDAKALGYCAPGIQAFQTRHGIGDSATLPELVKTGDPSAIALALAVARRVIAARKTSIAA